MGHMKRISGNKIYLSPIIESDYNRFYEWMNDKSITDNLGRSDKITSELSNRLWNQNAAETGKYIFSIVSGDDEVIGCCGINDVNFLHKTCELYIYIGDKDSRGKGYGEETIKLLIDYAFDVLNINSIFIKAFSFNIAAMNLYKKIGFKEIGVRRKNYYLNGKYHDTIYMDIIKEEYKKGEAL